MKYLLAAATAASLLLGAHAAMADEIFDYTGNNYANCYNAPGCTSDHITGTFTLSLSGSALDNLNGYVIPVADILSFSFSDGVGQTFSNSNGTAPFIEIWTNSSGQVTAWEFQFNLGYATMFVRNAWGFGISDQSQYDYFGCTVGCFTVWNEYKAGALTQFAQDVPEPATLALIGSGLAGMTAMRRRRRRKPEQRSA